MPDWTISNKTTAIAASFEDLALISENFAGANLGLTPGDFPILVAGGTDSGVDNGSGSGPGSPPGTSGSTSSTDGNTTILDEVSGNLGSTYTSYATFLLLRKSLRENSSFNTVHSTNMRFRGHRESAKFNLAIQNLLTQCVNLYITLKTGNDGIMIQETIEMYPTTTEIEVFNHAYEQIKFKEWLLLKAPNNLWFVG